MTISWKLVIILAIGFSFLTTLIIYYGVTFCGNPVVVYRDITKFITVDRNGSVQSDLAVMKDKGRDFLSLSQVSVKKLPRSWWGRNPWTVEQERRRRGVREGCARLRGEGRRGYDSAEAMERYGYTMVDDNKRIIYCGIPKVGATTWMGVFSKMYKLKGHHTLDSGTIRGVNLHPLTTYSKEKQESILGTYKTFLMVRHPLDRLISAYNDKFRAPKHKLDGNIVPPSERVSMHFKYGRDIRRLYKNLEHPWDFNSRFGYGIDFADFLRYLTDPQVPPLFKVNIHWSRYLALCPVCEEFTPDLVLKFENFRDDLSWLLTNVYDLDPANYTDTRMNAMTPAGGKSHLDIYKSVPQDVLTRVLDRFKDDMDIFGYDTNILKSRGIDV